MPASNPLFRLRARLGIRFAGIKQDYTKLKGPQIACVV